MIDPEPIIRGEIAVEFPPCGSIDVEPIAIADILALAASRPRGLENTVPRPL